MTGSGKTPFAHSDRPKANTPGANAQITAYQNLLPRTVGFMAELVADRRVLVSESGIHDPRDIAKLVDAGVAAVLVGESLMRSEDIPGAIGRLLG